MIIAHDLVKDRYSVVIVEVSRPPATHHFVGLSLGLVPVKAVQSVYLTTVEELGALAMFWTIDCRRMNG